MSLRATSGNDLHSSPSETLVTAVIWRRCPRPRRPRRAPSLRIACSQPPGPLNQPEQALPADNRRANSRLSNAACTIATIPTESVWSLLKRSLANLAKRDIGQLTALVKTRLRRMQYRPGLLDGFLAGTRLDLTPFRNLRN